MFHLAIKFNLSLETCYAVLHVEYLGMHKDSCQADCMFSRMLVANAT